MANKAPVPNAQKKVIGPEELSHVRTDFREISIFLQRALEICLLREQAGYRDAKLPAETKWEMKSDRSAMLAGALRRLNFTVDHIAAKGGAELKVKWGFQFPIFQKAI